MLRLLSQLLHRCLPATAIILVVLVSCGDLCFDDADCNHGPAANDLAEHGPAAPTGHPDTDHSGSTTGCCDACPCVEQAVIAEPSRMQSAVEQLARRLRPPPAPALEGVVPDIDLPPVIA